MNRPRTESRPVFHLFFAVFVAFIIVTPGGVLHAYYKNRQVQILREIDALDRCVEQYQLDVRTTDMRMDQLLNRYAIRKQLQDARSTLRPIPVGLAEEVDPAAPIRHSVASAVP